MSDVTYVVEKVEVFEDLLLDLYVVDGGWFFSLIFFSVDIDVDDLFGLFECK